MMLDVLSEGYVKSDGERWMRLMRELLLRNSYESSLPELLIRPPIYHWVGSHHRGHYMYRSVACPCPQTLLHQCAVTSSQAFHRANRLGFELAVLEAVSFGFPTSSFADPRKTDWRGKATSYIEEVEASNMQWSPPLRPKMPQSANY